MELRDKIANKNSLDDLIAIFKNGVQKFDEKIEKINQNKEIKHFFIR